MKCPKCHWNNPDGKMSCHSCSAVLCEQQPATPSASLAGSIADSLSVEECREIISAAHDYLRNALELPTEAPMRFDFYAEKIEELREQLRAWKESPFADVARGLLASKF